MINALCFLQCFDIDEWATSRTSTPKGGPILETGGSVGSYGKPAGPYSCGKTAIE